MVLVKRPCVYTYRSLDFFAGVDDAEGPQRGARTASGNETNTCVCLLQRHTSADTGDIER